MNSAPFQKFIVSYLRTKARTSNPGLQRTLNLLSEESPNITKLKIDEEQIEELEFDVSKTRELYDAGERKSQDLYKKVSFQRIERKYFDPNGSPNLLTWAEKEQIRFLHNSDEATWTPDKLSKCFPATLNIIQKILKSEWKPPDSERIKKHDEAVAANWRAFEKGQLKLPSSLDRHIRSFTSRKSIIKPNVSRDELCDYRNIPSFKAGSSEFINIIIKKDDKNMIHSENLNEKPTNSKKETYILGGRSRLHEDNQEYTLEALRTKLQKDSCTSYLDDVLLKGVKTDETVGKNKIVGVEAVDKSNKVVGATSVSIYGPKEIKIFKDSENLCSDEFILKITIPKDKWVDGGIYKVNDCFYNNAGDFLYRVPGLKGVV